MLFPDDPRSRRREFVSEGQANGEKRTWVGRVIVAIAFIALLAGCQPAGVPPVAKLGLIAPFEGPSRASGYSILYAVQLRIQQWNDAGGIPRIELVALNDNGDPDLSAQLPAQLALDPNVVAVLGPPQSQTARAVIEPLTRLKLPALVLAEVPIPPSLPVVAFTGVSPPSDFAAAYEILAGEPPTPQAALAYAATDEVLRLLASNPDRAQLARALSGR